MALAKRNLVSVLALAAGALSGAPALAQFASGLPLTQFNLQAQSVFTGNPGIASSGTFFASGFPSASGPVLSVHGAGPESNTSANNEASASAVWAFHLSGPANVIVPIVITGLYSASFTDALGVSGGVALGEDRFRLARIFSFRCTYLDSSGCDSSQGNRSQNFTLDANARSGVTNFILTSVGGSLFGTPTGHFGEFSAMIDPIISIDPSFARAGEFTLSFSPDAYTAVAAVPEPETYALLLAGLAVVGTVARRRRRRL